MEKELSRFELAVVKRTAQSTKTLRNKRDRIQAKIDAYNKELAEVNAVIEKFEAPIREITGGLSSEEVLAELAKDAEVPVEMSNDTTENVETGEVDETATTDEVEVPAEEAVEIDPNVESPLAEDNNTMENTPNEDDVMAGSAN